MELGYGNIRTIAKLSFARTHYFQNHNLRSRRKFFFVGNIKNLGRLKNYRLAIICMNNSLSIVYYHLQ